MDLVFAEARSASRAAPVSRETSVPVQPLHREGMARDEMLDAIPTILGMDELQDENDTLYLANLALEAGVRSIADMVRWLDKQESLAKMSRMWDDGQGGRYPSAPRGKQIAKYLRDTATLRARHG